MTPSLLQKTSDRSAVKVPDAAFRLQVERGDVQLTRATEGAEGEAKTTRTRFAMLVNSGKPMAHPWFGMLGVNLAGVKWAAEKMPVLLDHDTTLRLGFTTKLEVTKRGLVAEGDLLSNENARAVAADSSEGFPWQASCYLRATKLLEIRAGEEHTVNGHTFTGPGYVFEESLLREVTFCALGADPNTNAATLAGDVAGAVVVPLSNVEPPMNEPQNPTPPAAPDNTAALATASADAQKAERDRVSRILRAASTEQAELRDKLIADGVSLADAMEALALDGRNRATARLAAAGAAGGAPLAAGNTGNTPSQTPAQIEAARLAALPDGEEKWRAQFAADAKLRAEFGGKESVWLSYCRNKDHCRAYGSAQQFADATKDATPAHALAD